MSAIHPNLDPLTVETEPSLEAAQQLIKYSRVYTEAIYGWRPSYEDEIGRSRYVHMTDNDFLVRMRKDDYLASLLAFAEHHPQAYAELCQQKVDAFHGTSSLNIKEVLRHGLVPSKTLIELGILALGRENFSQPNKREGVHFVPLGCLDQTIRYAEERLNPLNEHAVTPTSYKEVLQIEDDFVDKLRDVQTSYAHHLLGRRDEALYMRELASKGELDMEAYPIVIGIASKDLPTETRVEAVDSEIAGDVKIFTRIPNQALRYLFVPVDKIAQTEHMAAEFGLTPQVRDLALIRP